MKTKVKQDGAHLAAPYKVNGHVINSYKLSKKANGSMVKVTGKYTLNVITKVEKNVRCIPLQI